MKVSFSTIKTQGALLPQDILQRIAENDKDLGGLSPAEYHLPKGERLNEAINNSWNRVLRFWERFEEGRQKLEESMPGTSETRENLLLPLFQELGYGRLFTSKAQELEEKTYPISHFWHRSPIHLVGCGIDLDKRAKGVRGAAQMSPHALVQEFLNRSDEHLWGFLSNGLKLRILRDNASLSRQSFVEFDLESLFSGQIFSDFVLLWLLCHQSRVETETTEECWLETWTQSAQELGIRALDNLRVGVEQAINVLGQGFLSHPANAELKKKLRSGDLSKDGYFQQLLRLIYRLLFLFAAEERGLLLDPKASDKVLETYYRFYSTARLRNLADKVPGSKHHDLYQSLKLVMQKLGSKEGCPALGLQPLGTYLWLPTAIPDLEAAEIDNASMLKTVRHLSVIEEDRVKRPVDYKNIGAQELGSVYESLLELHPVLKLESGEFTLSTAVGHERKTTGSYYTPTSLISCLLDSALDPVLEEAAQSANPESALLNLKVCDPACGSGHFLIAAAHRLSEQLAKVRTGEDDPSPETVRTALHDVISHCIYGVDINPMAVELCKVNLWLESMEPGKPLSFLEHRILCGNSLLGATPALMAEGIPDDAFKPIEGDDKELCRILKKQNKEERAGQRNLFDISGNSWRLTSELSSCYREIDIIDDQSIKGLRKKREIYERCISSKSYWDAKFIADSWCNSFISIKKEKFFITNEIFNSIKNNPDSVDGELKKRIHSIGRKNNFFHWHLEFPDIFMNHENNGSANSLYRNNKGFDIIIGNPPYGNYLNKRERNLVGYKYPDSKTVSNTAADFISLCNEIISRNGLIGLVVPKSITYSYSWENLRKNINHSLVEVVDVSKAWRNVLLEQVLITYGKSKDSIRKVEKFIHLGRIHEGRVHFNNLKDKSLVERLGIIPTGLSSFHVEILNALYKHSNNFLGEICFTSRGTGLQKYLKNQGDIPVVGGRDISDFSQPSPKYFINKNEIEKRIKIATPPQAVFQNIIAHLSKPYGHIKLIGTVLSDQYACLDTINLITIKTSKLSPWGITALLLSDLINWYVYNCIYNNAIRTMHFDGYFLKKIPIPDINNLAKLNDYGLLIERDVKNENSWKIMNKYVYEIYGISNKHGNDISNLVKPRWLKN